MNNKMTFEEAMKALEQTVKSLDDNEISLDEAVNNYKKGIELSKFCYDKLNEASQAVVVMMDEDKEIEFDVEK